jgi:HEAT repeat protein
MADRIRLLTNVVAEEAGNIRPEDRPDVFQAALQLGQIGREWKLPAGTLSVLASKAQDTSFGGLEFLDTLDVGSGPLTYHVSDGPRVARLMWAMDEAETHCERLELLWDGLNDPGNGAGVRVFCADALAASKCDASLPYLVAASVWREDGLGGWYVAGRAATALGEMFPRTRDALMALIDSPTGSVARIARDALRERALESLALDNRDAKTLATYLDDEHWLVRRGAVACLAIFTSAYAFESAIQALRDPDPLVRQAAAIALGEMAESAPPDLAAKVPLQSSLTGTVREDPSPLVRLAALKSLQQVLARVPLTVLAQAMRDSDAWVRAAAIEMISADGGQEASALLRRALFYPADGTRALAVEGLAERGLREAVPELIAVLQEKLPGYVVSRYAAAKALKEIPDKRAVQPLIDLLDSNDDFLQQLCAEALGRIGDPRAIGPLKALIEREPYGTACQVAQQAITEINETPGNP